MENISEQSAANSNSVCQS